MGHTAVERLSFNFMDNKQRADKLIQHAKAPEMAKYEELVNISESLEAVAESFKGMQIEKIKGAKGDKGDKGDQGEQGIQGEKGDTGADSTVAGERGEKGDKGDNGVDGLDGIDGKDGADGKDGKDGKDGIKITAKEVKEKLESLKKNDRLDIKAIKGAELFKDEIVAHAVDQSRGILYAGLLENNGTSTGTGITDGDKGDITVSGSGATWTIDSGLAATKIADGTVSNAEFQYLGGVTSDVQTQLNAKGNVSKVGTPVNNQIGVWTGDGTIEGDANLTWDGSTHSITGTSLLPKTGTATVGTQTYDSNTYKFQGSQWFTTDSIAKTITGGLSADLRQTALVPLGTINLGYAIDSSTERAIVEYKAGDHYNDGFAGQLTLRSGYWDGIGGFATGFGSSFGGVMETQYDGTFAFRPIGASASDFSGMRALSFGTHSTYAPFWSRWGYAGGANYSADLRTFFNGVISLGAGLPSWNPSPGAGASGSELLDVTIDQAITGNDATRPALKIVKTTEQLRVGYDTSNYFKTTINSTGSATLDLVGTSPEFTFSDPVNVPDEAYGAGWNGNTEVPTKNALYDKIETLGGSGITRTVVTTSGSLTLGATASTDYVYYVAGAHTLSMPSPNTNRYTVKNLHSAAITIDTAGAENIEGAASLSLQPNDSVDILSDGTNWYIH